MSGYTDRETGAGWQSIQSW